MRDSIRGITQGNREEIRQFSRLLKAGNAISAAVLFPTDAHAAIPGTEQFAAYLAHLDEGLRQCAQLPDMTVDDRITRVSALIRHMSEYRP